MVFGLVTGVIGAVVDVVDDVANEIDDALFGTGELSQRQKAKIIEDVTKWKAAGFSDSDIKEMLELKYA